MDAKNKFFVSMIIYKRVSVNTVVSFNVKHLNTSPHKFS